MAAAMRTAALILLLSVAAVLHTAQGHAPAALALASDAQSGALLDVFLGGASGRQLLRRKNKNKNKDKNKNKNKDKDKNKGNNGNNGGGGGGGNDAGNGTSTGLAPAWRGRLDTRFARAFMAPSIAQMKCKDGADCSNKGRQYPYEEYVVDPTNPDSLQPVMRITYPKGSWSPGSPKPGGTLFYAYPYKADPKSAENPFSSRSAAIEYEVYFPSDFDFVKGGKMPGMSGGASGGRGCGGGVDPNSCFSFRLMWRTGGAGEAYLYVPEGKQRTDFCTKFPSCSGVRSGKGAYPCTECNYAAGVSFGRGSWFWQRGAWNKVHSSLTLNDVGQTNGRLEVKINGQVVLAYDGLNWRDNPSYVVEGMEMATWFGGSDETWSPPRDTYTLFRNFRAYRSGPSSASDMTPGPARSAVFPGGDKSVGQVVTSEVIEVSPY